MKRKTKRAGLIPLIRGLESPDTTVEVERIPTKKTAPTKIGVRVERLSATLQREICVDWRRVCALAIDVCGQLSISHRANLGHGGLNPDKIVAEHDAFCSSNARIVNPSLLSSYASLDSIIWTKAPSSLFPAERFLSPEQKAGKKATPASDVYALGAIMYTALTGSAPDEVKKTAMSQFGQVDRDSFCLNGYGVPPALELIIKRCLKQNPKDRYKDSDELRSAIIWWEPEIQKAAKKSKMSRQRAAQIAVGVVAAIVCLVSTWALTSEVKSNQTLAAKPKSSKTQFRLNVVLSPTEFSVRSVPVLEDETVIASDE